MAVDTQVRTESDRDVAFYLEKTMFKIDKSGRNPIEFPVNAVVKIPKQLRDKTFGYKFAKVVSTERAICGECVLRPINDCKYKYARCSEREDEQEVQFIACDETGVLL